MYTPERSAGHSSAAISFAEIMINAGAGSPDKSVFVSPDETRKVRAKVKKWNELTQELRREITVFV